MLDYSEADRNSKARQVVAAMETVGFMLLENVPGYSEDDLRWCQEFFFDVMPPEKKLEVARVKYNPANKHVVSDIHMVPMGDGYSSSFKFESSLVRAWFEFELTFELAHARSILFAGSCMLGIELPKLQLPNWYHGKLPGKCQTGALG